ncbi:hypothetical protein STAS_24649, partial [Striga asiatica]
NRHEPALKHRQSTYVRQQIDGEALVVGGNLTLLLFLLKISEIPLKIQYRTHQVPESNIRPQHPRGKIAQPSLARGPYQNIRVRRNCHIHSPINIRHISTALEFSLTARFLDCSQDLVRRCVGKANREHGPRVLRGGPRGPFGSRLNGLAQKLHVPYEVYPHPITVDNTLFLETPFEVVDAEGVNGYHSHEGREASPMARCPFLKVPFLGVPSVTVHDEGNVLRDGAH